MKFIPNKAVPFLATVFGLVLGYMLAHPVLFDLCQKTYTTSKYVGCLDDSIELIGYPFVNFFIFALPVTVLALFIKREAFNLWVRFAIWWIPLSLLWSVFTGTTDHQTHVIFEVTHSGTAKFFGILFVWISLCFFIFKSSFFQERIHPLFHPWLKFTAWYVPFSVIFLPWVAYFFEYGISTMRILNHTFFLKGTMSVHFEFILFVIISLCIFALKSWQLRKQEKAS